MTFFSGHQNFLSHLGAAAGGFAAGRGGPYDEYLRAYSVAMLPGKERDNVSYGGKIIMPPSALANLTASDMPSPWIFKLRNPANSAASTYAGVLEFIADEGSVHLPYWMMKSLRLNEGDPIRISGAELEKGKFVKFQAQSVHFIHLSDPKAVLEQAMRNFSTLTQGDIIEIKYNSIVFGLLVMETKPGGEGINIHDTDLEVDFATPVGYVEPERPKAAPPPTMASKLKIDLDSSSPGSSRPASSLGGGFAGPSTNAGVSKDGDKWESFKGKGETLAGRKTKGKGISVRQAEAVVESSRIYRTDQHRIVNNETLESDVKVPAALNLPFGQLFFGFNVATYVPPPEPAQPSSPSPENASFGGSGNTLNGRQSTTAKGKEKEKAQSTSQTPTWASTVGQGNTLGASVPRDLGPVGAGGARVPRVPQRGPPKVQQRERSPTPDFGVDDDDDAIMIDSD
ncbi:Ubiquitin fusion degradation protein 1 [Mycena indigotica]|uniref:Ubiquitin fusion degradation protein 1 n=1 Tax=Mycena indigotica TaxID=2126181 RepID=A0A8H6S8H1_9AGAR|nr:Ubiquitin fusion degradation protein 1 [Mycena indigotica]KAF7294846.1 Ubiquitin fusion degradation protein 1 [Mycena indigotica]